MPSKPPLTEGDAGETGHLRAELAQRDTELAIIKLIHEGMVAKLGFPTIVDMVGDRLRAAFDTEDLGIRWYDPESDLVHFPYELERGQRQRPLPRKLARGGTFDQVMKTRRPLVYNSGEHLDDAPAPASGESLAWILVPIVGSDRVRGAIVLEDYRRPIAYGALEVQLLTTVAASMGVALENAELLDQTQHLLAESERRSVEEKLRLEIALAQQMELNSLRSTFVAMTSHEFRTPLTTIKSSQDLLRFYSERMSAPERNEILDHIDTAVERMVAMLDQVLTLSRAEAQMLEFHPGSIDLARLCQQLCDEAIAAAMARAAATGGPMPQIRLDFAAGNETVNVDEKLLRHVLSNLLSNALKYSPQTASAHFRVAREGGMLVFTVSDSGIGIPAKDLPHLFDSYRRGGNVGDIPGTGLGLAIVKRAVENHGGTIAVDSVVGRGTTFTVRVPIR